MSLVSRYLDPSLLEQLQSLQLSARSVVEGTTTGQHRSPVRGASVEFRQHRAYVAGDEPRRLDWRVLARTDRPFVREYDEETNLRCVVLLDRSGSMAYSGSGSGVSGLNPTKQTRAPRPETHSKFDYAARLVASLAYLMLGQTESVGLATGASRIETWLPPHTGTGQLARVIDVLERTSPAGSSDLPASIVQLAERLGRRSLVVIVSDFFCDVPPLRAALARLEHARHEAISLRVLDDNEISFPFRKLLRLRGLEGEGARVCEPAVQKRVYLEAFNAHARRLHEAHRASRAEFHTFPTDRPLADALVGFLRHRQEL